MSHKCLIHGPRPEAIRRVTEREAWLILANAWDNSFQVDNDDKLSWRSAGIWGGYTVYSAYGLCYQIAGLLSLGAISARIEKSMLAKFEDLPSVDSDGCGYKWQTTKNGARQRARFCREQAERLAVKRKAA